MYKNFLEAVNVAVTKDENKMLEQIEHIKHAIDSKRRRSIELQEIYENQLKHFETMFAEYGYSIIGFSVFNFESNRVLFIVQKGKDGIKHHIDMASNNKKKTGRYYVTMRATFDDTMYNNAYSDDWEAQRNVMISAMNARPRCHVRVDSPKELKDIFFNLLNELEEVRKNQNSERYRTGVCYMARQDMETLKCIEKLD